MIAASILVVDDDPLICKGLRYNLERAGYAVTTASNVPAALDHVQRRSFSAAILDIGLPGDDGLTLCRRLKAQCDLPVILLTARRRELDEIIGLEVGADDYITKPFSMDLLLARLKAVLRRMPAESVMTSAEAPKLTAGAFSLEPLAHRVTSDGRAIELAPREFDLLRFFITHPDRVFTTDEIIERVWGSEFVGEPQVVYVQIRSLREKIERDPSKPVHLKTLRGVGYKFVP
jgi:DNA-binding response OmpR family regulator